MKLVFYETPLFTRLLPDYLDDEAYRALQSGLMMKPEMGDIMPGTGGFRKLRWHDQCRGKGKRGGLRVIYYYLTADRQIWFFTIYDKNEATDLTPADLIPSHCRGGRGWGDQSFATATPKTGFEAGNTNRISCKETPT